MQNHSNELNAPHHSYTEETTAIANNWEVRLHARDSVQYKYTTGGTKAKWQTFNPRPGGIAGYC